MNSHHIPHAVVAETRYPPAKLPNHPDLYPVIELLDFQEKWMKQKAASKPATRKPDTHSPKCPSLFDSLNTPPPSPS